MVGILQPQYIQIVVLGIGLIIAFFVLRVAYKIFKAILIALGQAIVGVLEVVVNILRVGYNLCVKNGEKLPQIVFVKIDPRDA